MSFLESIRQTRIKLQEQLIAKRGVNGLWNGFLSSSAVSTAVAVTALDIADGVNSQDEVDAGVLWLCENINEDGGWGDSTDSPSNLSAVLLSRAALLRRKNQPDVQVALKLSDKWLIDEIGGVDHDSIINGVLSQYGKDMTFSVPILAACALSSEYSADFWKKVPPLPFELAILPTFVFKFLRLPVVSYAIPALISVGLAKHRISGSRKNPFYHLRELVVRAVLKKLAKMQPSHGGFLEAAPLTAFVTMSLFSAGEVESPVVKNGISFLKSNIRKDGSWPIDTNLSLWLTSLSIKALKNSDFIKNERDSLLSIYERNQLKTVHPFTKAKPGGWGWSDLPGSVPDADDSSAALYALLILDSDYNEQVEMGTVWLLNLMNSDGGIPTFCRGWGHLPFDRSCPDISAHTLIAFTKWFDKCPQKLQKKLSSAIDKLIVYLVKSQDKEGAWTPLWFGDQHSSNHSSRVYGTATVLESLVELSANYDVDGLIGKASQFLLCCQNADGGWGGEKDTPSVIETTGRAVSALAGVASSKEAAVKGAKWLVDKVETSRYDLKASPIGLYFASLWYSEKLYPLVFTIPALINVEQILKEDSCE